MAKQKAAKKTVAGTVTDDIRHELFIAFYCERYWEQKLSAATIKRIEAIPGWDWNFTRFLTPMPVLRRLMRELGDVLHERWILNEPA